MIDFRAAVLAEVISDYEAALLRDAVREISPGFLAVDPQALCWVGRMAWQKLQQWRADCMRCGK